jgi:hypothetical protein
LATNILEINKKDYSDTYKYFSETYERYLNLRNSFMIQKNDTLIEKPSNTAYIDAKKQRNQKQKDEKRFKLLEKLIPETEEKIKLLEDKISGEYATDYVKLQEATNEKDELDAYLLEILEEYYALSDSLK